MRSLKRSSSDWMAKLGYQPATPSPSASTRAGAGLGADVGTGTGSGSAEPDTRGAPEGAEPGSGGPAGAAGCAAALAARSPMTRRVVAAHAAPGALLHRCITVMREHVPFH